MKSRECEQLLHGAWWRSRVTYGYSEMQMCSFCGCFAGQHTRRPTFRSRSEFYSRPFAHPRHRHAAHRERRCVASPCDTIIPNRETPGQRLLVSTHCQRGVCHTLFCGETQHAIPRRAAVFHGIIVSVEMMEILEV